MTPRTGFTPLDSDDPQHYQALIGLNAEYMAERFLDGDFPAGSPAGPGIKTLFILREKEPVGLLSYVVRTRSLELVYVRSAHRGLGLATQAVQEIQRVVPDVRANGPLSAAGRRLVTSLGIRENPMPKEIRGQMKPAARKILRDLCRQCTHGPQRPCRECVLGMTIRASLVAAEAGWPTDDQIRTGGVL